MNITDGIKRLLSDNNKSQSWMAEKMGYTKATAVNNILRRGNITLETLIKMCDILEYEVTVQPKRKAGARPNGQVVFENENGKEKEEG